MRGVVYVGLLLSAAGAALDFASAYTLTPTSGGSVMGGTSASAILSYALGAVVAVTGVLLVLPRTSGRMRLLGLLMEALGVAMVLVSLYVPGMVAALSGGMLAVGALMILNGIIMGAKRQGNMAPA
jgi:hypothetical protein